MKNFENITKKEIDDWINNICEIFHNNLNILANAPHPEIFFINKKFKDYIKFSVYKHEYIAYIRAKNKTDYLMKLTNKLKFP